MSTVIPAAMSTEVPSKVDQLVAELQRELREDYSRPHLKRHAHPKMHGCVQASLQVDAQVPPRLRHGVFAEPGRRYRAWVRFSNALGIGHDLRFSNRGMAIKLLDVTGERLLPNEMPFMLETGTQDFVLSTGDAFALPNVTDYQYEEFAKAAREGFSNLVWLYIKYRLWSGLRALVRGGLVLARNPLTNFYFSQTPYRLGPLVVKVHARPRIDAMLERSLPGVFRSWMRMILANVIFVAAQGQAADDLCDRYFGQRNLMRQALSAFLATSPAQFDIMVQPQADPASMPADDATASWSVKQSPFERVATLTIPQQVFWPTAGMPPEVLEKTIAMMDRGENLSFMPWHGLIDHEPLGDINNARRRIYAEMCQFRHHENQVTPQAPCSDYQTIADVVQSYAAQT